MRPYRAVYNAELHRLFQLVDPTNLGNHWTLTHRDVNDIDVEVDTGN